VFYLTPSYFRSCLLLWASFLVGAGCTDAPDVQGSGPPTTVVAKTQPRLTRLPALPETDTSGSENARVDESDVRTKVAYPPPSAALPDLIAGSRYRYPRGERLPVLEGVERDGRYRFVQVSTDSVRQVTRFFHRRFSLAPYQFGTGERSQYLFSQGTEKEQVSVRIAPLDGELDGLVALSDGQSLITLRMTPLIAPGGGDSDTEEATDRQRNTAPLDSPGSAAP